MATQMIPIDWFIVNLDNNERIEPPYPLGESGLRVSIGSTYAEQARFGFQDPIIQWVTGKAKVITFQSVMFAPDTATDITEKFEQFEQLAIKDDDLGRPPICSFTLGSGSILSELCVVESVDPDIPPVMPTGEPRQIILNFTLRRYVPFALTTIDPTKPAKQSYFLVASSAEASYEAIAKNFYGDPLKGDRLRKRHPEMPMQPFVGTRISIPARDIIQSEPVEPAFHALSLDNEEAVENFQNILDERNEKKVVFSG
jgi:hypothetical protein